MLRTRDPRVDVVQESTSALLLSIEFCTFVEEIDMGVL